MACWEARSSARSQALHESRLAEEAAATERAAIERRRWRLAEKLRAEEAALAEEILAKQVHSILRVYHCHCLMALYTFSDGSSFTPLQEAAQNRRTGLVERAHQLALAREEERQVPGLVQSQPAVLRSVWGESHMPPVC